MSHAAAAPTVRYEVRDDIGWLTIDNPAQANCLTIEMIMRLDDLWMQVINDADVHAVVLTGAGERHFCAGVDRSVLRGELPAWGEGQRHNRTAMTAGVNKPVITLVNGAAIGLGMNLALDADMVVATRNAHFGDPRVRFGLLPNAAIVNAHNAPLGEMVRLGVAGKRLTAQRAREIGLIVDVVDSVAEARTTVANYAKVIAAQPTEAVREAIRLLRLARRGESFQRLMSEADAVSQLLEEKVTETNRASGH